MPIYPEMIHNNFFLVFEFFSVFFIIFIIQKQLIEMDVKMIILIEVKEPTDEERNQAFELFGED